MKPRKPDCLDILKLGKKKSFKSPLESLSWQLFVILFSGYDFFLSLLSVNFILTGFSRLFNTDKCEVAYGSKFSQIYVLCHQVDSF